MPRASIVSGYFNPMHVGHLAMMEAAQEITGYLIVIVNNDDQQVMKKGKVITEQEPRLRIVRALRIVDEALIAVDDDNSVSASLAAIRDSHPDWELIFCNGGDRVDPDALPSKEAALCAELGIEMRFGVGGNEKMDSSTRILSAMSPEQS